MVRSDRRSAKFLFWICAVVVALALQACYIPPTQASLTTATSEEGETSEELEDEDAGEMENGDEGDGGENGDNGDGEFDVDPWEADGLEITFEPFPEGSIEPGVETEIGATVTSASADVQVESYQWLVDNEEVDGAGGGDEPESFTFVRDTIGTYLVSLEVTVTVDGETKLYIKSREIEVMPEFD